MAADASDYAALGLDPDADAATIEGAYRRLIKQHHPDRAGGDPARAAEINRAYREIRAERDLSDPLDFNVTTLADDRGERLWLGFAILLVIATLALLLWQRPLSALSDAAGTKIAPSASNLSPAVEGRSGDPMDQPLDVKAIDAAVRDAIRLRRSSDEMTLARTSRDCHHLLRTDPNFAQLDRCAAFDDAVVQLQDRDPLRDQGPFSELAVTGRVWGGATALSDDSVAIDNRLDRIRLQVDVALSSISSAKSPDGAASAAQ